MSKDFVTTLPSAESFTKTLAEHDKVIVKFTATWCAPCKMIAPKYLKFAEKFHDDMLFAEVDISDFSDSDGGDEIMNIHKIRAIPAFVTFLRGTQTQRMVGVSTNDLKDLVDKLAESK